MQAALWLVDRWGSIPKVKKLEGWRTEAKGGLSLYMYVHQRWSRVPVVEPGHLSGVGSCSCLGSPWWLYLSQSGQNSCLKAIPPQFLEETL